MTAVSHAIEKWYTGKALATIQTYVLPTLEEARALGYWPKGAARKVTAVLNKQTIAARFAKENERDWNISRHIEDPEGLLCDVTNMRGKRSYESTLRGQHLVHAMMFGLVSQAPFCLEQAVALSPYCRNDIEHAALATAHGWAADFAPVAELIALLDSRRPIPTLVCKTLSPTVLANVGKSMGVALDSIEVPEIVWQWVKVMIKGREVEMPEPEILWPEGTRHNVSRFAQGTAHNFQCHACGHAIKNAFNWVPLVAKTANGPVSLWVGRDCAKKLFNCEVDGDALWAEAKK